MTETRQITIQTDRGTWVALAGAGALLVAGVLAAITLGIGWMGTTFQGGEVDYELSGVSLSGANIEYDEFAEDSDVDGVGMIATARILALVGTIVAFVAMASLAAAAFLGPLRLVASIVASVAALLIILTVVFAPLGIDAFHEDSFGPNGGSLEWGAGLILGIVAAVLALGGAVMGFVSRGRAA